MTRRQLSYRSERVLDVVQGLLAMASIVLVVWIAAALAAPRIVALMPHLEKAIGVNQ
jgi:uncharacterized membrane protein YGL010W